MSLQYSTTLSSGKTRKEKKKKDFQLGKIAKLPILKRQDYLYTKSWRLCEAAIRISEFNKAVGHKINTSITFMLKPLLRETKEDLNK